MSAEGMSLWAGPLWRGEFLPVTWSGTDAIQCAGCPVSRAAPLTLRYFVLGRDRALDELLRLGELGYAVLAQRAESEADVANPPAKIRLEKPWTPAAQKQRAKKRRRAGLE